MRKIIAWLLKQQVKLLLKKHKPRVIVISGSVGKTSTTQAIAKVLAEKFRVRTTSGNYNTNIGVPCSIFGHQIPGMIRNPFAWLKIFANNFSQIFGNYPYDFLVLELGTDQPGDVPSFDYLKPEIAVVTAVTHEHMEFFDSIDDIAKEELAVVAYSQKVFCNNRLVDKQFLSEVTEKLGERSTVMGCYDRDDVKAWQYKLWVIGEHSLDAVAAAAMVAQAVGMTEDEIKAAVEHIRPQPGRMQPMKGIKNSKLIDDTYNASPEAMKAALKFLFSQHAPQKIALLGQMNELGRLSESAHREIGSLCTPKQLDLVVTLGTDANNYIAGEAEDNGCRVIRANSPVEAGQKIKEILKDGAMVLLKGSQNGVFAEEAVKQLLADPAHAHKLVRQSPHWMKRKRAQFSDIV